MKLYLIYNDDLGYVTVEVSGNMSFLDGKVYFTDASGEDMVIDVEQLVDIGITNNIEAI